MKIRPVFFAQVCVTRATAVPGSRVDGRVREASSHRLELLLLLKRTASHTYQSFTFHVSDKECQCKISPKILFIAHLYSQKHFNNLTPSDGYLPIVKLLYNNEQAHLHSITVRQNHWSLQTNLIRWLHQVIHICLLIHTHKNNRTSTYIQQLQCTVHVLSHYFYLWYPSLCH